MNASRASIAILLVATIALLLVAFVVKRPQELQSQNLIGDSPVVVEDRAEESSERHSSIDIHQVPARINWGPASSIQANAKRIQATERLDVSTIATPTNQLRNLENEEVIRDTNVVAAQYGRPVNAPTRTIFGVGQNHFRGAEPTWNDQKPIPWELLGPGEFLGPIRLPFESNYRVRLGDQLEMTFSIVNGQLQQTYRLQVGDEVEIQSGNFTELDKQKRTVLPDGHISANEIGRVLLAGRTIDEITKDIDRKYRSAGNIDPQITVAVSKSNSSLTELIKAVQGQFNAVGSIKQVTVSPDGTIQLPNIGRVCVYGLTLDEIEREVNLRYSQHLFHLHVTPSLLQLAAKTAFVFGEVQQPGVVALNGPTTALSAIAAAQGANVGANLRQVIVIRRDSNWRMIATKLDLSGAALGKTPVPADDIWLRPNDIIIVPKTPILRLAEFIDLVFTRSIYAVLPNQGFSINFDEGSLLE